MQTNQHCVSRKLKDEGDYKRCPYLADLLQRGHKVLVACYGEGQEHVERLQTERAALRRLMA